MDTNIQGRVALVTGGSGAIGRAIATVLAAEGARVAISWHSDEVGAHTVTTDIERSGGVAMPLHLDQGDPDSISDAVQQVGDRWGAISVLVANAVSWPRGGEGRDTLLRSMVVNVAGTIGVAEAVLPGMRAQGWGRIVLISTDIVVQPMAGPTAYPAAKGAIETAAHVMAVREAQHGILVNVVRPGLTLTEHARKALGQETIDAEAAKTPTGRICTPEDVASAVIYLGSAANSHVNGETVSVSGGRHLSR